MLTIQQEQINALSNQAVQSFYDRAVAFVHENCDSSSNCSDNYLREMVTHLHHVAAECGINTEVVIMELLIRCVIYQIDPRTRSINVPGDLSPDETVATE